ncbi:MAG TPA: GNAT family N-acetyltransferase [Chitinophagaceae bacterium]|nr:GNAT family N-acetyltransferase [Chitinophagaceae bacterium]
MIVFETARLIVRYFRETDIDNFFLVNGDPEIMRYIRAPQTREATLQMMRQAIENCKSNPFMGRWAIEEKESGEFVGSFAVIPIDQTPLIQMGYALLKNAWGKGYATELTKEALRHVFTKTSLESIRAVAETGNDASHGVLIKAGFKRELVKMEGEKELVRYIFYKSELT